MKSTMPADESGTGKPVAEMTDEEKAAAEKKAEEEAAAAKK